MFRTWRFSLAALTVVTTLLASGLAPIRAQAQGAGWEAKYFDDSRGYGYPPLVRRVDAAIDFDWGYGAPAPGMPRDHFSVQWSRTAHFDAGTYRFTATSDDGIRVYVDGQPLIDEWHDHAVRTYQADTSLAAGDHLVSVSYYENGGVAVAKARWDRLPDEPGGWRAEYYANRWLDGEPALVRAEDEIDHYWQYGRPASSLPNDDFSARWTRDLYLARGWYRFTTVSDDGIRVYVDDSLIIDEWSDHAPQTHTAEVNLSPGSHRVVVEYYERSGLAVARLSWVPLGGSSEWQGEYYANRWLQGEPAMRRADGAIAFDWGYRSPGPGIPWDGFSARWTRTLHLAPGTYRFTATSDDGVRVWVNGRPVIDAWVDQARTAHAGIIYVSGDALIEMEYYENRGVAAAELTWQRERAVDVSGAVEALVGYWAAIADRDYACAYGYWANGGAASGQTYEQFAAGFADTAGVTLLVGEVDAPRGPGAPIGVPVTLMAVANAPGGAQPLTHYRGAYTLAPVDGAWRIDSASIIEAPAGSSTLGEVADPLALLDAYFEAINEGELARAYTYWNHMGAASGQTYAEFAAGLATTAHMEASFGTPQGSVALGSAYCRVPVDVVVTETGGTSRTLHGTYTLRRATVPPFDQFGWRIERADVAVEGS